MNQPPSTSRLSTVASDGRRLWVYPADVSGRYRQRRNAVSGVLLILFLVGPWIRIGGHPALLLDIHHGIFSLFGFRFWSHDAPMLLFVFGGLAILLAFVTSVWGRVWCGWACPQTVFVDMVFRRIERWIEGDAVDRRRLDSAPASFTKFRKKSVKWLLFLIISLVLSHSFLAYFIGTEALASQMSNSPLDNLGSFIAMAILSTAVLLDFGWLREQFCTLICPYGRFQSVLMDDRSLAIAYDKNRGEPRRGAASGIPLTGAKDRGDCIDCLKCVRVCPTGIDIRNGLQMECIACTACADACDAVMRKIGKPEGLIRYTSGWRTQPLRFARPLAYLFVLTSLAVAFLWTTTHRENLDVILIRAVGTPYDEVNRPPLEKEIVNHFKLDLLNQSFASQRVELRADNADSKVQIVTPSLPLDLSAGESRRIDFFVRFPISKLVTGKGRAQITLVGTPKDGEGKTAIKTQEVPLVGPFHN